MHRHVPVHIANSIASDYLKLIILPTEKCNLRCTYCYEDFSIGRILPEVVQGIKRLISKRGRDLRVLHLSWFGGEPLLAPREIEEVCRHAQSVAQENAELSYQSSMTTNGVLLDLPMAHRMARVGVHSYQISLDGPAPMHDQSRVTVSGDGTYDSIWRNLCALADSDIDFNVNLRIHYRADTWRELFPLLDSIKTRFGGDRRFQPVFNPIVPMGGKNDHQIIKLGYAEKQEIAAALYARVGVDTTRGPAAEATDTAHAVCYAATANSLVIRAHGAINKCTVALNDDRNDIGRINADGTFTLNRDKYLPWMQGLETQDAFALACPYSSHIRNMPKAAMAGKVVEIRPV